MRRLALTLAALVGLAHPAAAYFEDVQVGARGLAMGPGAIAVIEDASAYHWNPAALARLSRGEVLVDYAKPYGIPGLDSGAGILAIPAFGAGWTFGWRHLGLDGAYSEDLLTVAAGRRILSHPSGHRLDAGATIKFGRASFSDFTDPVSGLTVDYGTVSRGSLDAGLLWTTPWRMDVAYVGRDLIEPRYEFVAGTGGERIASRHELAAGFRWNRESTVTLGWSQVADGGSSLNAGIEVEFYEVFAIRSGLANIARVFESYGSPNDLQYLGGFGVRHKGYFVDVAASTNRDLGASYRVTVRMPFAAPGAR
jgi:hypothetical protein